MSHRYSIVTDDKTAKAVAALAHEYGLTEEEVIQQLIETGLEVVESPTL